jgi:hypothetical protein
MLSSTFLGIPPEIRSHIYHLYLDAHLEIPPDSNRQPTNHHIQVLRVCSLVNREAGELFRQYVSLRHERQIQAFILHSLTVSPGGVRVDMIRRADVANDGRYLLDDAGEVNQLIESSPAVLGRLKGLCTI